MLGVAVAWQMYSITGSAFDLGLVGLAQFLPMVLLTLAVGHVADRYDRRMIVRVCQGVMGSIALIFIAATLGGWLSRNLIFGLVTLLGASRAFEVPSMMALLPGVIPRASLRQATAWSTSANQTAQILGPSLAGILYAFGPALVYGLILGATVCGSLLLAVMPVAPYEPNRNRTTLASLFSGIGFVRRNPTILGALSLDLFAVLLGGATALLPIFAHNILGTGPWGLGLLRAAPAAGALTMSLILARWPMRSHAGATMLGGVALFGLATVVFGLSRSLPLSLCALGVLGAADTLSVVVRLSLVQLRTPPGMLGRVSALNALFIGTSNQLGEFESGATAALFGTVPAVLIGGVGTILVAALWAFMFPSLRGLRELDETPGTALETGIAEQPV
jgi:MFS family permease